jgi:hypothetical protein
LTLTLILPLARCSYEWVDDDTIAALVVPEGRGPPPPRPPAPIGPSIQDNTDGRTSQVTAVPMRAGRPCAARHQRWEQSVLHQARRAAACWTLWRPGSSLHQSSDTRCRRLSKDCGQATGAASGPPRGAQARTYPDLLAGPHDEALFEHYMTSQLVLVSVRAAPVHAHLCVAMLSPSGRAGLWLLLGNP